MQSILVYYRMNNGHFRTYCDDKGARSGGEYETRAKMPLLKKHRFELMPGFKADDEGLLQFFNKFCEDREELLERFNFDILFCDYKKKHFFNSSNLMTLRFFQKYENKVDMSPISFTESELFDKCYCAGMVYGETGIHENIYDYDYTMFYPRLLTEFEFPVSEGYYSEFHDVSYDDVKTLKYGMYHCIIDIDNPDCRKVFMQKKTKDGYSNWHTHYDIIMALKLQKYRGGVTIRPLGMCYVYDELVDGKTVFGPWYNKLYTFKKTFPKNIIVKKLSSSLWGYLTQSNKKIYDEDEAEELDLTWDKNDKEGMYVIDYIEYKTCNKYTLVDLSKPLYKFNYRIKPFITAFGRSKMCETLFCCLPDVVRIATDGFMIKGPYKKFVKSKMKIEGENMTIDIKNMSNYDIL